LAASRPLPWPADPGNQAMSPHTEGETGTHHSELTVERGRKGRGMLENVLTCKITFAINAIAVKAASMSQSRCTWNPGTCTYRNTADNYRNAGPLCC